MLCQWKDTAGVLESSGLTPEEGAFSLPLPEPPVIINSRKWGETWPQGTETECLAAGRVGKGGAKRSRDSLGCPLLSHKPLAAASRTALSEWNK